MISKVIVVVALLVSGSFFLAVRSQPTITTMDDAAAAAATTMMPMVSGNEIQKGCQQTDGCMVRLNNGVYIPQVGLGTSRMASTDAEVIRAIKDAIDVGYRHIDTAHFYQNEKAIGQALEELIRDGKVTREQLFITTKVWSNHHTVSLAIDSVRRSLADLRLAYLDLVLVHWPVTFVSGGEMVPVDADGHAIGADLAKENFTAAYQGLEQALQMNLTRAIGISNFNMDQMERLLAAVQQKPAVNQVECHPYLNQQKLLDYCNDHDIRLEAYSPLRRGDPALLEDDTLKTIAAAHNRTVAQVILRWHLQRDIIVIPKSSKRHRMVENLSIFDFQLNPAEMASIMALNKADDQGRAIRFESSARLPEYPFGKKSLD